MKNPKNYTLDVEFTDEEIQLALSKLKKRKAAGPDGLMAEHLQEAGWIIRVWLRQVLQAVVSLEEVPAALKLDLIVPVYKGGKGSNGCGQLQGHYSCFSLGKAAQNNYYCLRECNH